VQRAGAHFQEAEEENTANEPSLGEYFQGQGVGLTRVSGELIAQLIEERLVVVGADTYRGMILEVLPNNPRGQFALLVDARVPALFDAGGSAVGVNRSIISTVREAPIFLQPIALFGGEATVLLGTLVSYRSASAFHQGTASGNRG